MTQSDQLEALTGGAGLYWILGAVEGAGDGVERDRQNRDFNSDWTSCCENPANISEQVQHKR